MRQCRGPLCRRRNPSWCATKMGIDSELRRPRHESPARWLAARRFLPTSEKPTLTSTALSLQYGSRPQQDPGSLSPLPARRNCTEASSASCSCPDGPKLGISCRCIPKARRPHTCGDGESRWRSPTGPATWYRSPEAGSAARSIGHAAVRYANSSSGNKDVLPTIGVEMRWVRRGAETLLRREAGSSL